MEKIWHDSFQPIIDEKSKVLILGSFPSVKSRQVGFYYGNPQNRFWGMLGEFFRTNISTDILERKQFLLEHRIALWDVVDKSTIAGSSDSELTSSSVKTADIKSLVEKSNIKLIILNGKKAFSIFEKIYPDCKVEYIYLPSTSPANVSYDKSVWFNALNKSLK